MENDYRAAAVLVDQSAAAAQDERLSDAPKHFEVIRHMLENLQVQVRKNPTKGLRLVGELGIFLLKDCDLSASSEDLVVDEATVMRALEVEHSKVT
eukprot:7617015-Pyramimonas_sp.AAC.1